MNRTSRAGKRRWVVRVVLGLSLLGAAAAFGQATGSGGITAREVVSRMLERNRQRAAALDHYTTDRTYRIAYTGTGGAHQGELRVHAEYLGAERKSLTVVGQSGSPFLCNKVLRKLVEDEEESSVEANRMMMLTPANYDVALAAEEILPDVDLGGGTLAPVKAWVITVTPTRENRFGYVGKVWISEDDYAIIRIVGDPVRAPSFWMEKAHFDSRYMRRGQIWLPGRNVSSTHLRFGGDATLSIDYGSYPEVAARAVKPVETLAANHTASAEPGVRAQ